METIKTLGVPKLVLNDNNTVNNYKMVYLQINNSFLMGNWILYI